MSAMPVRLRTPVAVVCIAIAIFAACVPSVVLTVPFAILAPAWLYRAPDTFNVLAQPDPPAGAQKSSLLRLVPARAPPGAVPAA
jgi:hypothetical protein